MREPEDLQRRIGPATDEIAPVWVLDDPADGASAQAIAIADRLGVPNLRVPLAWNWRSALAGWTSRGSLSGLQTLGWPLSAPRGPALVISGGVRSQAVALWLRAGFGARIVHCGLPRFRAGLFDLVVEGRHLSPPALPNLVSVLGEPNRLSPLALSQARVAWAGRLSHLPRPIVSLLVGGGGFGGEMRPAAAHTLGRQVARMAAAAGGSVLATTSSRTGREATDALAAGLSPAMHLLYRWGEPGENPYAGMIGLADAIVVSGDSISMISEACGAEAPVFIASLGDSPRRRRLHATLYRAGQARPLADTLSPWPRAALDEAGRVAGEIRARMSVGPQGVD
jgi:mitochondrial fission protein ELM1